MAEADVERVLLLLEGDRRKLADFVERLPDLSDRDTERRKEARRLMVDLQDHLAALKVACG
jgi:hypothetical protein